MSKERRITDHTFILAADGHCAHEWVTHGSGTERERCREPQERHMIQGFDDVFPPVKITITSPSDPEATAAKVVEALQRTTPGRNTVFVYTTDEQSEQPITIRDVTALTAIGGLLTIECEVRENNYTFTAHHRYQAGKWRHFEVHRG